MDDKSQFIGNQFKDTIIEMVKACIEADTDTIEIDMPYNGKEFRVSLVMWCEELEEKLSSEME